MTTGNHTLQIGALRKASWGRAVVIPWLLLAFLLQIFVVQTHIHFPSFDATGTGRTVSATPSDALRHLARDTGNPDTTHCPWCLAVLLSGSYLSPAAAPLVLPAATRLLDRIVQHAAPAASTASHAWRSRAPPAV